MATEALIKHLANVGQVLSVRWGHQPWSNSWAREVAKTLLRAIDEYEGRGVDQ